MSIRTDIAKKGSVTFFGSVTGAVLRFFSEVVVARALTVSEFGIFGLCISIVAIAQVLVSGGFRAVTQRYTAIYFDQGDYRRLANFMIRISMVLIFLFPAVIISILLLSESLASWSGESRISGLMLYLVWAIPLFAVIYIIGDYFRAIHRVLESTLIREVLPSALFLIGLMLIFFLDFTDLGKIILTYSMSLLPVAALAIAWAVISMRQMNGSSLNIKHNDDSKRSILVFAFSSAILQALWIFRERVTLFLVSHEMTAADVSLYFV
ncbi:MAG TPA: hypothetical protein ENJ84_06095, partial [Gammaproteobacteria bacterium]|nr:hypothetical protein [Gammaproteobacteria bacterium]